ncbi:RNA 3'-phosphate cyclase [Candidatus Methanoperedens nitroreducens]|uniref:RNA 3'-terminal phosphate cyclase n=2 Tax=Candidatus Methanoperedens nitratireducens TaxID=1392998 RepID=A0A062VAV2_9EURY|nr:RNA 3'-phosphate cyclase [Candidatus Methanoperedens nitroreducens]
MDNGFMKLDGSYGEGGGQILRTAVALSAVTGKPVEIYNIRKKRPKPGLAAQHVKAVESVASICEAEMEGCSLHSTRLSFKPGKIKGGAYEFDIGTAGSISLLLQCLMPAAMLAPQPVRVSITGGTDVSWSPSIDYMRFVTLGALSRMGYDCGINVIRRGYYPRGGGNVEAIINPSVLRDRSFDMNQCAIIEGISHSSGLPPHVTERQASSAEKILREAGYPAKISLEVNEQPSTGSGLTLWCGTAGGTALGRPGLRAEKVGSSAAESILAELKSGAGVDIYLADQLIPYIALAGGGSFTTRTITLHTKTSIWVTEQFLDVKFNIEELKSGLFRVSVLSNLST